MGNLRACFAVAVMALAACGDDGGGSTQRDAAIDVAIDSKVFMDAPPPMFDLGCIGNAAPTLPADVDLSGTAQMAEFAAFQFSVDPVDEAAVDVCTTVACNGTPPTGATDPTGDWSIAAVPASNSIYLAMTKQNVRTTFVYPGAPFAADQPGIPILTFGPGLLGLLDQGLDCDTSGPLLAVAVTDCDNTPISDTANISIVVKQGGVVVPNVEPLDLSSLPVTLPPEAAGLFLICGVPANNTTNIGATYKGMTLLAHDVKLVANTTTTTQVRPGY